MLWKKEAVIIYDVKIEVGNLLRLFFAVHMCISFSGYVHVQLLNVKLVREKINIIFVSFRG